MEFLTTPVTLVEFPIIMGIMCLVIPDIVKGKSQLFALVGSLTSFIVSIFIFIKKPIVLNKSSEVLFVADNLSGFITLAVCFFALLITIYSCRFFEKPSGRYFGYLLMTLGASVGVALANNLIVLLVCWGFLAAMLYLMTALKETDAAAAAAKKALIIVGGTDALMIFGIGLAWTMTGTFSMDKIRIPLNTPLAYAAYFSIVIAAFAKAGVMPFHSWLPGVAEDAPTPVAALLPASLDKLLGIYLLARASMDLFIVNGVTNFILLAVGSATIVFAVIFALVQHDLKRLLGYHAVSQVGYMVLGIGTGTPIGIAGGLFHMLNNAIYKSCLFLASGDVEKSAGSTDLDKLGGLARFMPVTFISFLVASLSISGIPPFNGFVSKWMVYQGIIESAKGAGHVWIVWLVAAMFGSALTVASFMKLLHAVFLGRPARDFSGVKEAPLAMTTPVAILAGLCVIFGLFAFVLPIPLLIAPAVKSVISYIGIWNPLAAAFFIIIGVIMGVLMYVWVSPARFRSTETFIGGEKADSIGRVSGVDFYNTIKDLKLFGFLYDREESGSLDIYTIVRKAVFKFTRYLQFLHNGILPTYMVWCLLGMIAMFALLLTR